MATIRTTKAIIIERIEDDGRITKQIVKERIEVLKEDKYSDHRNHYNEDLLARWI
jgi:hypothetical protein